MPPESRPGNTGGPHAVQPAVMDFLADLGFDLLSLSNNHAWDLGDCGVAGMHRLLAHQEAMAPCCVLICCAGFEGALPSVLWGLMPQPIIAVPTSIGYGVAEGGRAALHGMLASCASGITVMNIDNGCGAAVAALRILRQLGAC